MLPSLCGSTFGYALLATSGEVREDEKVAQLPVDAFRVRASKSHRALFCFCFFGLDLLQELGRDSWAVLSNIRYAFF